MFKSRLNKKRKIDQDSVWVNFVLLLTRKEHFSLECRDLLFIISLPV